MFDSRVYFVEPGWHFMYELFKVLKVMTVIDTRVCACARSFQWHCLVTGIYELVNNDRGYLFTYHVYVGVSHLKFCHRLDLEILKVCNCLLCVGS
jgi:hypothetical protein